jgi:hypothetical protein
MDLKEKVMDKVEDVIESIDGDELCESVAVELHLDDPEKGVLDGLQEKLISRNTVNALVVKSKIMVPSQLEISGCCINYFDRLFDWPQEYYCC